MVAWEQASGEREKRRDGLRSPNYFFALAGSLFAVFPVGKEPVGMEPVGREPVSRVPVGREPVRRPYCG